MKENDMQYTKTEMETILSTRVWEYEQSVKKLKAELKSEERYLKISRKQLSKYRKGLKERVEFNS